MKTGTNEKLIVAKDYFRSTDVNEGHYSKKREGVADVDPKVRENQINSFLIFSGDGAV